MLNWPASSKKTAMRFQHDTMEPRLRSVDPPRRASDRHPIPYIPSHLLVNEHAGCSPNHSKVNIYLDFQHHELSKYGAPSRQEHNVCEGLGGRGTHQSIYPCMEYHSMSMKQRRDAGGGTKHREFIATPKTPLGRHQTCPHLIRQPSLRVDSSALIDDSRCLSVCEGRLSYRLSILGRRVDEKL